MARGRPHDAIYRRSINVVAERQKRLVDDGLGGLDSFVDANATRFNYALFDIQFLLDYRHDVFFASLASL